MWLSPTDIYVLRVVCCVFWVRKLKLVIVVITLIESSPNGDDDDRAGE